MVQFQAKMLERQAPLKYLTDDYGNFIRVSEDLSTVFPITRESTYIRYFITNDEGGGGTAYHAAGKFPLSTKGLQEVADDRLAREIGFAIKGEIIITGLFDIAKMRKVDNNGEPSLVVSAHEVNYIKNYLAPTIKLALAS